MLNAVASANETGVMRLKLFPLEKPSLKDIFPDGLNAVKRRS